MSIIGAGSFGLVVEGENQRTAIKLIYDLAAAKELQHEAAMQQKAQELIAAAVPEVGVPDILNVCNNVSKYNDRSYLYGLTMSRVPFPPGYNECVHITLGYSGYDLNTSWGVETLKPVGPDNPTRGFFADANHLEDIWAAEGSDMTVERLADIMGRATACLVSGGFLPLDVEWIWSRGQPWLIDFGMCTTGSTDKAQFLDYPIYGPNADIYIPKAGDEGYNSFMNAYLSYA
jgi:hypothetical protein